MTATPDLSNAITCLFPHHPGARVWAQHVWQQWADAGLVPGDLDEDTDHAPALVLIGALALVYARVHEQVDELQEDLHGSWPLMSPFQLGYYCGAHGIDPILPGDDFTASLSASEHALPLAMRFLRECSNRELAFADLRSVEAHGQQEYPLQSAQIDLVLNYPTIDSIAEHEHFVELWDLGGHITCTICAAVIGQHRDQDTMSSTAVADDSTDNPRADLLPGMTPDA